jgi:hypothetical protein
MAGGGDSGSYIQSTQVWDPSILKDIKIDSPQFKELLIRMYQNLSLMASAVNNKDTGLYDTQEFVTGQTLFPNPAYDSTTSSTPERRNTFRKTFDVGALGAGLTTIAHGLPISDAWTFTRIYGAASLYDAVPANCKYYPIPWASAAGATNIELKVDGTNILITNNSGVAFTHCYVVLEYMKT